MLQTQNRFESLWAAFKLNIESIEHKTAKRLNYALMMSATLDNIVKGWRGVKGARIEGRLQDTRGFFFEARDKNNGNASSSSTDHRLLIFYASAIFMVDMKALAASLLFS